MHVSKKIVTVIFWENFALSQIPKAKVAHVYPNKPLKAKGLGAQDYKVGVVVSAPVSSTVNVCMATSVDTVWCSSNSC